MKVKGHEEVAGEANVKFRHKPGVDWEAIEAAVRSGESFSQIERIWPITRQRVAEVAKQRGWVPTPPSVDPGMDDAPAGASKWYRAILRTDIGKAAHPCANKEAPAMLVDFVNDSRFSVDVAACVLNDIADAVPEKIAVQCRGVELAAWQLWRKTDVHLDALVRAARAEAAKALVKNIRKAADYDWKSASYLLEREVSKEEYAAPTSTATGGPSIVVQVNVQRDEQVAIAAGVTRPVIDITPMVEIPVLPPPKEIT